MDPTNIALQVNDLCIYVHTELLYLHDKMPNLGSDDPKVVAALYGQDISDGLHRLIQVSRDN